jgi:uncharacterized membrane protein YfcA
MAKLLIIIFMSATSWFGWWLGEQISPDDISAAVLLSLFFTPVGVILGWWLARRIES